MTAFSDIDKLDVFDAEDGVLSCAVAITSSEGELIEVEGMLERGPAEEIRDWLRSQIGC